MPTTKQHFGHYYHSVVPHDNKIEFRDSVLAETEVSIPTFYDWVSGETTPSKATQTVTVDQLNKFLPDHLCVSREQILFGEVETV